MGKTYTVCGRIQLRTALLRMAFSRYLVDATFDLGVVNGACGDSAEKMIVDIHVNEYYEPVNKPIRIIL